MIKCIGYLKSLKQLFIIGLISCFILLGNSFVSALTVEKIGVNMSSPVSNNNTTFSVLPYGSFMGSYLGVGKPVIAFANRSLNSNNTRGQYIYFMRVNGKPYFYYSYAVNSSSSMTNYQGFINEYKLCDELTESSTSISNCSDSVYFGAVVNDFLSTVKSTDYYGINWSSNRASLCISSSQYSKSLCFWDLSSSKLTGSINIPSLTVFEDLDGYDSQSPAVPIAPTPSPSTGNNQVSIGGGLDGYDYTKIDTGDIVYYFENNPYYRYDVGVCYVGTDDFDTLYSSGSTLGYFRSNNGGTIFDLFSDKFGNSFSLNNVGAFINARNINYFTWFKGGNRDENNIPLFNAYYTLGSGFYQDFNDDLIVPFIGNPIAYYFMGYVSSLYGEYSTPGQSIATYCYYKLGLDKDSGGLDIVDDTSDDYLNGASDFINQRNKFYGLNSSGINIQSQSWSGSVLDYFTGGQDNYDFNTFFSSSFNKFKDKINLNLTDLGAGFLPTWIIMFLMAIILFRFLSH